MPFVITGPAFCSGFLPGRIFALVMRSRTCLAAPGRLATIPARPRAHFALSGWLIPYMALHPFSALSLRCGDWCPALHGRAVSSCRLLSLRVPGLPFSLRPCSISCYPRRGCPVSSLTQRNDIPRVVNSGVMRKFISCPLCRARIGTIVARIRVVAAVVPGPGT